MKEYINPLLRVFTVVALIAIIYNQHKTIQIYKQSSASNVDSLEAEVFILQSEIGRYEMATEILKEEDSVAGNKLETILNKETE